MVQQQVRGSREEHLQVCMSKGRYRQFLESTVELRMAAKRFIFDHYDRNRDQQSLYKLGMRKSMSGLQLFSFARTTSVSPQQDRIESCLRLSIIMSCLAHSKAIY